MPHISQLKQSKFLTKDDVGSGALLTIRDCTQENVAMPGAPQELKWALHFDELDKPLILNSTNGQIIAAVTGSEDTDGWVGKKIVLYTDPNIQFQGKLIGGIRARAPKAQTKPAPVAPKPAPAPPAPQLAESGAEPEDDVPF